MEKGQTPLFADLTLAGTKDCTPKASGKFTGTTNPRHLRVIFSLLISPRKREDVDRIAGASNSPELIAELRRRGLEIFCAKVPGYDRDGLPVRSGVYHLTDTDRRKVNSWLKVRVV